jgi:hypothetical protein
MRTAILAALWLAIAVPATAQHQSNTTGCSSGTNNNKGQGLSGTLSRNNGVLCPPDVDPAMKKPTPKEGKMPVIPPPGSPGGDPNIQPK